MDVLVFVGRILYVAIFLSAGVNHFRNVGTMTRYTRSKGLPAARFGVIASGVVMLAGGLMVLLGVWPDIGALLIAAFLLTSALLMHDFWRQADPMARMNERVNFFKNISLAGASIILFVFFGYVDDLHLTIIGPLFHLD
jgi:putative oxidoreductase